MEIQTPPVFRFAPSPNGELHLGHAYSALLNFEMAQREGGRLLLRIEDIDTVRCRADLEAQMLFDLEWLGIEWDGVPRRQSEHFDEYREGLETLAEAGMIYPSFISRGEIRKLAAEKGPDWPTDPDGAPIYPGDERHWSAEKRAMFELEAPAKNQRLAMDKAIAMVAGPLHWLDTGAGPDGETGDITARPEAWGDLVIARQGTPTSYHLSVVLDDALQGVTNVVRGSDVFHATSVHRLLQHLLGIPAPVYHHHELILDQTGRKLSKSLEDTSLRALRESGATPQDLRRMIGL